MGWRSKTAVSLFGAITVRFAYYHCVHCGRGCRPWCDRLRLGKRALTPAGAPLPSPELDTIASDEAELAHLPAKRRRETMRRRDERQVKRILQRLRPKR